MSLSRAAVFTVVLAAFGVACGGSTSETDPVDSAPAVSVVGSDPAPPPSSTVPPTDINDEPAPAGTGEPAEGSADPSTVGGSTTVPGSSTQEPERTTTPTTTPATTPTGQIVRFDEMPRITTEPIFTMNPPGLTSVFYDMGFDEFVAAQRAAILSAGYSFSVDKIISEGVWRFAATKDGRLLSGTVLGCALALYVNPEGVEVSACSDLREVFGPEFDPPVQMNLNEV
jgi:hypothetical protein